MKILMGLLGCVWVLGGCAGHSRPDGGSSERTPGDGILAAWVEWVPEAGGSHRSARVITANAVCPTLELISAAAGPAAGISTENVMQVRAASQGTDFPVVTCEAAIPSDTVAAEIILPSGPRALPLMAPHSRKIVVIGDTGCRIAHKQWQACNDPAQWPFGPIARAAAAWKPDLVIHVGDYYYRETACPPGNAGCEGASFGDHWKPWQEDFFIPAAPLLKAAPWIIVRGNHEDCQRGGAGWDRFLEPRPYPATCTDDAPPYAVELGGEKLWVIDSAVEKNVGPSLAVIRQAPARLNWLVTHRPLFTSSLNEKKDVPSLAIPADLPKSLQLILSGHIHELAVVRARAGLPTQIISGNGGSKMQTVPAGLSDQHLNFQADTISGYDFGFLTLERKGENHWEVVEHDRTGAASLTCQFYETTHGASRIDCPSP